MNMCQTHKYLYRVQEEERGEWWGRESPRPRLNSPTILPKQKRVEKSERTDSEWLPLYPTVLSIRIPSSNDISSASPCLRPSKPSFYHYPSTVTVHPRPPLRSLSNNNYRSSPHCNSINWRTSSSRTCRYTILRIEPCRSTWAICTGRLWSGGEVGTVWRTTASSELCFVGWPSRCAVQGRA